MAASFEGLVAAWWKPKAAPWVSPPAAKPGVAATPAMVLAGIGRIRAEAGIIHSLQTERGLSCVMIAGGGEHLPHSIETLDVVRKRTDDAIANSRLDNPLAEQIDLIRMAFDSHRFEDVMAESGHPGLSQQEKPPPSQQHVHRAEGFLNTFDDFIDLIDAVQAELVTPDIAHFNAATIFTYFSQLKDAVGVVRVFVAAALVMTPEALTAVSDHLRGTLVVALHKQRACAAKIRLVAPRKLLSLVEAGFTLPPELARVQSHLEDDFSIGTVRDSFTVSRWWELATSHIEKLHSLQATLLFELERTALRRLSGGGSVSPSRTPSPRRPSHGSNLAAFLQMQMMQQGGGSEHGSRGQRRGSADSVGGDDSSQHSSSSHRSSSSQNTQDWSTLWGARAEDMEQLLTTLGNSPPPPPRRNRTWPLMRREGGQHDDDDDDDDDLLPPPPSAHASKEGSQYGGGGGGGSPSRSHRTSKSSGSRNGSRNGSKHGSKPTSHVTSPRQSRPGSTKGGTSPRASPPASVVGGLSPRVSRPSSLVVDEAGGIMPCTNPPSTGVSRLNTNESYSSGHGSGGEHEGGGGGAAAAAAGGGGGGGGGSPARASRGHGLTRPASFSSQGTSNSRGGLVSEQKAEVLLRAAASMLVLGPQSARGGGMSAQEVRSSLLNTPPAALVRQLVSLLDEETALALAAAGGDSVHEDDLEGEENLGLSSSPHSPMPSPKQHSNSNSVENGETPEGSPPAMATEGGERPALYAESHWATDRLQGQVLMELPTSLEERHQQLMRQQRQQQQQPQLQPPQQLHGGGGGVGRGAAGRGTVRGSGSRDGGLGRTQSIGARRPSLDPQAAAAAAAESSSSEAAAASDAADGGGGGAGGGGGGAGSGGAAGTTSGGGGKGSTSPEASPNTVRRRRAPVAAHLLSSSPTLLRSGSMGEHDPMSEWMISLHEVAFQRKIGAGSAGTTYMAEWRGASVAVKVAGYTGASMEGWRAEVDALTRLRHPNIVQYLGCVVSPPTYCLVLEFCDAGDLYRALRLPSPPGLLLRVARAVGSGMAYLHRRQIMHRDLKSSNVLLTTSGGVKLTDFGVAVNVGDGAKGDSSRNSHSMETSMDPLTTETGTYRWMAPEVTRHEGYTKSADVFSYAMLLFELLTHEVPFADRPPLQAAVAIGLQDLRPPLPTGTPPSIESIVKSCWARRPRSRPKFEQVLSLLHDAQQSLTLEELSWLNMPMGHPVYGNPNAGQEKPEVAAPPAPPGANRPAGKAVGDTMGAIIESQGPAPDKEKNVTWTVGGT